MEKYPAYGKNCTNCLKKNHVQAYANSQRKTMKEMKKTETIWKFFQ